MKDSIIGFYNTIRKDKEAYLTIQLTQMLEDTRKSLQDNIFNTLIDNVENISEEFQKAVK